MKFNYWNSNYDINLFSIMRQEQDITIWFILCLKELQIYQQFWVKAMLASLNDDFGQNQFNHSYFISFQRYVRLQFPLPHWKKRH